MDPKDARGTLGGLDAILAVDAVRQSSVSVCPGSARVARPLSESADTNQQHDTAPGLCSCRAGGSGSESGAAGQRGAQAPAASRASEQATSTSRHAGGSCIVATA